MGMFKQSTHVSITVADIGKAREFYVRPAVERERIEAR